MPILALASRLLRPRPGLPTLIYRKMSTTLPTIPGTDPSSSVLDTFRIAIAQQVADALPSLTVEQVYGGVDYGKKGEDFTIAIPRFRLKEKPDEVAAKVVENFKPNEYVSSITHDKTFLHFTLNTPTLISSVLNQIHAKTYQTESGKPEYGTNQSGKGKKVIVEYSSPNIAKNFHVGHLRSTIIGAFVANLYKACGWEVISMNYLGDWGTQFGLIASGFEKYGSQEALEKDAIQHLFEIYVKVSKDAESDPQVKADAAAWFKRMEDGDETALNNWRKWRELSIKKYTEEYERLNIFFDVYTGESEVKQEYIKKAVDKMEELGLLKDSDGAKVVDLQKYKLGSAIVRKKDGTSIYLTRDIGGIIQRYDTYKFDKLIYVISSQQDLHTAQFFKVVQLMGYPWAQPISGDKKGGDKLEDPLVHINYGLVQGMSTRKGTVVFLDQIIKEAAGVMHEQMQKNEDKYKAVQDPEMTSREISISGIKIQDMTAKRINNYTFNWDRMLSFEGDTGPYLQYAHTRLCSLERKNPELLPLPPPEQINTALLAESPHARDIAFLLGTYPDVVKVAMKTHEPSGIVTFGMRLAHAISSAWETVVVKGEEDIEKARARMYLFQNAKDVLGAAMRLLSLRPLERM